MENKDKRIEIRITEFEKKLIAKLAFHNGADTNSEYIRSLIIKDYQEKILQGFSFLD